MEEKVENALKDVDAANEATILANEAADAAAESAVAAVAASALPSTPAKSVVIDNSKEIDSLKEQVVEKENEITVWKGRAQKCKDDRGMVVAKYNAITIEFDKCKHQVLEMEGIIEEKNEENTSLKREVDNLKISRLSPSVDNSDTVSNSSFALVDGSAGVGSSNNSLKNSGGWAEDGDSDPESGGWGEEED